MKKLLSIILLTAFVSCSKTSEHPTTEYYNDYQFKVISVDLDNTTVSQTSVWNFSLTPTIAPTSTVQTTSDGDPADCSKHPDNPNCTVTPVIFDAVNFTRSNYEVSASWIARVELNVRNYYVEGSTDSGKTWTIVETLAPKGQGTTYTTSFSLWTKNIQK